MFLRKLLVLIAIMICYAAVAPAEEARSFGGADKIAIEQLYGRYLQAFIQKDYAALRECVQAPFVVVTGGEMRTLESLDSVIAFYRVQLEALERRNYDRAVVQKTRITPLTAESALINKAFRRYKKDGSVLENGAAVYPVSKSAGAWKLRGMLRQEPQYFGKTY